jgi:hypothetical protein
MDAGVSRAAGVGCRNRFLCWFIAVCISDTRPTGSPCNIVLH